MNGGGLSLINWGDSVDHLVFGSEGTDTWACTTWDNGAGACGYIGIGFVWNDYD